jgi:putative FmdB family regulatory protein
MPTYDYVCDACDHRFELFQSIKADPERKCPECRRLKLRRLIGPGAAILFKGSGFYQTDYRSESYKSRASSDAPAASSGQSASSDGQANGKAAQSKGKKRKTVQSSGKD